MPPGWWILFLLDPAVWVLVAWIISLCGWRSVARKYPAGAPFSGRLMRFQGLRIDSRWWPPITYNGVVHIGVDLSGLRLAVFLPFRAFHPPIFVPWPDVRVKTGRNWFGRPYADLRFDRCPGVTFRLRGRAVSRLADARPADSLGL